VTDHRAPPRRSEHVQHTDRRDGVDIDEVGALGRERPTDGCRGTPGPVENSGEGRRAGAPCERAQISDAWRAEDASGEDGPVLFQELSAALEQEREIGRVVGLEPGEDVQEGEMGSRAVRIVADEQDTSRHGDVRR
jgi:hypothetical protein